jgi:hypothetical protein
MTNSPNYSPNAPTGGSASSRPSDSAKRVRNQLTALSNVLAHAASRNAHESYLYTGGFALPQCPTCPNIAKTIILNYVKVETKLDIMVMHWGNFGARGKNGKQAPLLPGPVSDIVLSLSKDAPPARAIERAWKAFRVPLRRVFRARHAWREDHPGAPPRSSRYGLMPSRARRSARSLSSSPA